MGKKRDAMVLGSAGNAGMAFPVSNGIAIGGKKRKGGKFKGGGNGGGGILADEVTALAVEAIGAGGMERMIFGPKMEDIRKKHTVQKDGVEVVNDSAIREEQRGLCLKTLLGSIVAQRIFARGSIPHSLARSAMSVAAVNAGRVV